MQLTMFALSCRIQLTLYAQLCTVGACLRAQAFIFNVEVLCANRCGITLASDGRWIGGAYPTDLGPPERRSRAGSVVCFGSVVVLLWFGTSFERLSCACPFLIGGFYEAPSKPSSSLVHHCMSELLATELYAA